MDKRFFSFLVFAMAIMLGWQALMFKLYPPEPQAPGAEQQQAAAQPGEAAKPADAEKPGEAKPGEAAPPVANPAPPAAVVEAKPVDPAWTTLGSLDAAGKYRMLVTFSSRGAAVERVELNNPRYHDVDNIHPLGGYLGHLAPQAAAGVRGCKINVVGPGTPAAMAGLQAGDVLTAVGGEPTDNVELLTAALRKTRPGRTVKVDFTRDGKPQSIEVPLRYYPLEVVRPEAADRKLPDQLDPPSFLLSLDKLDDLPLDDKLPGGAKKPELDVELQGVQLRHVHWELLPADAAKPDEVAFRRVLPEQGLEVVKRYILSPRDESKKHDTAQAYTLTLKVELKNVGAAARRVAYRLDGPTGLPVEGFWYSRGTKIGLENGCGMRDVIVGRYVNNFVENGMFTCTAIVDGEKSGEPTIVADPALVYAGVDAQYFMAALLPQPNGPTDRRVARVKPITAGPIPAESADAMLTNVTFRLSSTPVDVAPGAAAPTDEFKIYLGPKVPEMLAEYGLDAQIDYGWFDWIAKPMLFILHSCYDLVGNYGLAIIMLTLIVRSCMFPLSRKQALGAMKMQELQPEIKRIAEKYKTQPEQRMKAQTELFRKHNYNPFSGCLPIFIQLPIFVGLYNSLRVDVELRQAPLISEKIRWASNLAAPDMFWYWQPYLPDILGGEFGWLGPFLNVLPCVTIVLFIVQQKMFMPPPTDEQSALQQKMMKYMMVFMGFMFFKVPAGLCVYFISSSIWSIAERKLLPKAKPAEAVSDAVLNVDSKPSSGGDRKPKRR